jgi:hypothetical protein
MSRESDLRPFSFDDLPCRDGKRVEPEKWGPKYSRPVKPGKPVDRCPTNCASGQKYDFDAGKHRAKIRAEFVAQANADRRSWAEGKPRAKAWGLTETIVDVYKAAMRDKRKREFAAQSAKNAEYLQFFLDDDAPIARAA